MLKVAIGDPAGQAIWEAYMALVAIHSFSRQVQEHPGTLQLIGDAEGVLKAVLARRARCPVINKIIMEIQLILGQSMADLFASHIWSEENEVADQLSRTAEGALLPPECETAREFRAVRPSFSFLTK